MIKRKDFQLDLGENYYDPSKFVDAICYAEKVGFETVWLGDHFVPWVHSGDRSAFIWSMLGVALDRTDRVRVGPLVTSPIGGRYHPAIIAQACATLDNMYPGRVQLAVGSGEAINERPFWNGKWPKWKERTERLVEGLNLMRELWRSPEPFATYGKHFGYDHYYLYTKPKKRIPVYFSAIGRRAAYNAGLVADGLVTLCPRNNIERLKKVILPAYQDGLRKSEGNRKTNLLVNLVFAFGTAKQLLEASPGNLSWTLKDSWNFNDPIQAEKRGKEEVRLSDVENCFHFCKNWSGVVKLVELYADAGAKSIILSSEPNEKSINNLAKNLLSVF